MPRISVADAGGHNRLVFLDLIGFSEGTVTDPVTKDDGYDVIVTGVDGFHRFNDYRDHPNLLVVVNTSGLASTAAGRYQLLHRYWVVYKQQLKLPDFSPVSQDKVALQQIKEQGALASIDVGNIAKAILKCSNIWASFPGNGYGQHQNQVAVLVKKFQELGGIITTT
jgi:muramidase (phage lysozyme)